MKDPSLFLLKNSLAAKMKRSIQSFCHGVGSTSTLNQRKSEHDVSCIVAPSVAGSNTEENNMEKSPLTLEEMLLQLDLEEATARRAKLSDYGELHRRMSCVNNNDVLKTARNAALNQYPRFSLDGRDAMYRSTFCNFGGRKSSAYQGGRRSICCSSSARRKSCSGDCHQVDYQRNLVYPSKVAGETVVWCKPGVVAKLMGLDAVPVPVGPMASRHGKQRAHPTLSRKQYLRRMGRYELGKERVFMGLNGCSGSREGLSTCYAGKYCMMKPISTEPTRSREDWRFNHAR